MSSDSVRAWLEVLAEALLHNLWQGALIAGLLLLVFRSIPACRSRLRYGMAFSALLFLVLSLPVTVAFLLTGEPSGARDKAAQALGVRPDDTAFLDAGVLNQDSISSTDETGLAEVASGSRTLQTRVEGESSWFVWIVGVWIVGVVLGFIRLLRSVILASGLRQESELFKDFSVEELARRFGLNGLIPVRVSPMVSVACVLGVFRPVVFLPLSMVTAMPREQLELVIAHEFAHLRRLDPVWNLLQLLIEALLFFNPFVWWIGKVVRAEREACCDEEAVLTSGRKREYLEVLLGSAVSVKHPAPAASLAFSGKGEPGSLLSRVRRLVKPESAPEMRLRWPLLLGGMATFLGVLLLVQAATVGVAKALTAEERIREIEAVREIYPQPSLERLGSLKRPDKDLRFEVSGILRTPDGSVPGERISIVTYSVSGSASIIASARAGKDGRFTASVRPGNAKLLIDSENFAPFEFDLGQLDSERAGLEFVLREGFDGEVRFVDAVSGEPLADVEVEARVNGGNVQGTPKERISDEEGMIVFEHMGDLPLKLNASLPGYGEGIWDAVELGPDQIRELPLTPTEPLRVEVRSAENETLLADASLRMVFRFSTGMNYSLGESGPVVAESGETGELIASSLRGGSIYYFLVEKEGFESAFIGPLGAGGSSSVELRKLRPVQFEFTGLDQTDTDLKVAMSQTLETPGSSSGIGREKFSASVADGKAVVSWTPPVRAPVRVEVSGQQMSFNQEEMNSGPIRIALSSAEVGVDEEKDSSPNVQFGMLKILVQTPENQPPAKGQLVVRYIENGDVKGRTRQMEKQILELQEGSVSLKVPYPNRIDIQPEGLIGYWVKPVRSEKISEPNSEITVNAIPAGAIFGSILESDGSPADNVLIGVFRYQESEEDDSLSIGVEVKNSASKGDEQDRFLASPLPLGDRYVISVSRGFTYLFSKPVRLDESTPLKELRLTMPNTVSVAGQVRRSDGSPAALQRMRFNIDADGGHGFTHDGVITDGNGRFVIDEVNPDVRGKTYLEIEGVAGSQPKRWRIDFGDSLQEIRLAEGLRLEGRVIDAESGRPVIGAEVYATREPYVADAWPAWFKGPNTDEDGRFVFSNLPPGEFGINTRAGRLVDRYAPAVRAGRKDSVELKIELYDWFDGRLAE